ncbi:Short chain dehydrogenase sirQ like protein [Verticillium longisporum]|uniref:Short chain dehydrogenase sirQ like protein n=1 Tax=Verticillium longisporum TaxID=100787 RepID=A0A8I2ZXB7_VERLO|nr:Short chain dehydrogenase sirQ like protein [Verticillium longisporum]
MTDQNQALVFGAAGLLGWAAVDQLLSGYPAPQTFSHVTAVVNRPVAEAALHWPPASTTRPKLHIASGVNLLNGDADTLARQLREKAPGIENVTHAFYFVFSPVNDDHTEECRVNCGMMQRVADALNMLCPQLKSIVYAGGTRGYGIYNPGGTFTAPLVESMADTLPEDYAKTVAYPWFRQILTKASRGRSWTWTEVCPDAVVGFSPNGSAFSLALHWAQYLALYRLHNESSGEVKVPFPGSEAGFDALFTPVSGRTLGRISVHAALHPGECGEKILNMADRARPTTFRELWPGIAGWFGLVGVEPEADTTALKPGEYVEKHKHLFATRGLTDAAEKGVGAGSVQLDSVGWWLTFDRQLSLERLKATGFDEERDPVEGWLEAFGKFRAAGIIDSPRST